jgi:ferrous iron transport protein A
VQGNFRNVAEMKPGEVGVISGFVDQHIGVKLMEMGCLPGSTIRFNFKAPLGDPICVSVLGYDLSIRVEEAAAISIIS